LARIILILQCTKT